MSGVGSAGKPSVWLYVIPQTVPHALSATTRSICETHLYRTRHFFAILFLVYETRSTLLFTTGILMCPLQH